LKLLEFFASTRNSAKDFTGDYITYDTYVRITKAVTTSSAVCLGKSAQIIAYVIRLRVKDLSPGCERLTDGSTPPATAVSAEDVGRHLWLACSSQNIVKSCAFAIVLTTRESELAASGHIGYRHTVLNAGSICAELYREAARCSLGTTSIGGFSDNAISRLLGEITEHPIIIQAFGVASISREKLDIARILGTPPGALSLK
jgi:hypothetical protein